MSSRILKIILATLILAILIVAFFFVASQFSGQGPALSPAAAPSQSSSPSAAATKTFSLISVGANSTVQGSGSWSYLPQTNSYSLQVEASGLPALAAGQYYGVWLVETATNQWLYTDRMTAGKGAQYALSFQAQPGFDLTPYKKVIVSINGTGLNPGEKELAEAALTVVR